MLWTASLVIPSTPTPPLHVPLVQECWTEVTRSTSTTALVVDNLSNDEIYSFRVSAVNRVGQGPFSKPITLEKN